MKENKKETQLISAEEILKDFIRKETEYLQSCNPTNELGEITGNDFAAGLVRGMNKVLEEYASQFKPSGVKTGWISVKERLPESNTWVLCIGATGPAYDVIERHLARAEKPAFKVLATIEADKVRARMIKTFGKAPL